MIMDENNSKQVYGLQKGGLFSEDSLSYLWKLNAHATSQINNRNWRCPPKVLLRTALSVLFFGNRIGRTVICHETTKGRQPFSYNIKISKHQILFLPFLYSLKDLQKLVCSLTCTSIMRSKDHTRSVKRSIAKMMFYSDKMMFNSDTLTLVNNNDFSDNVCS